MFSHHRCGAVADALQERCDARRWLLTVIPVLLVLSGCTDKLPPDPYVGVSPADNTVHPKPVTDTSVLGNYKSFRPVGPDSWREQNQRVAPGRRP